MQIPTQDDLVNCYESRYTKIYYFSLDARLFALRAAVMNPAIKTFLRCNTKGVSLMILIVNKYKNELSISSLHIIWLHNFNGCLKPLL